MPYRLTKIYTRSGDQGYTSLGDKRISKDDLLVEAVGTIDELNSAIGLILANDPKNAEIELELNLVQHKLFDMGGELHLPNHVAIQPEHVTHLEEVLDKLNKTLPPLEEFLLPQGSPATATCHLARTICRRAERCLVRLHRQVPLSNPELLRFINRLSDLLFVMARKLGAQGKAEKMWEHDH